MEPGEMTKNLSRIILTSLTIFFISQVPLFATHAQDTNSYQNIISNPVLENQPIDLLLFLSPQYGHDTEIHTAINAYFAAVKNDLHWTCQIIQIEQENNNYEYIDYLTETYHQKDDIKACLMVGEDLNTPLAGDCNYMEQPSSVPWSTTNSYETSDQGIICKPYTVDICISLLYPTHELSYETKKADLISAFTKFSTQRHPLITNPIQVLESSDLNTYSKQLYQQISTYGTLTYIEDATEQDISTSSADPYTAFFVHGHSSPAGTDVNAQQKIGWFTADTLDDLNTPLFGADGCYAGGWWSNQQDNNLLDSSIDATCYGSKIFTNTNLQVMALGLLSQNGFSTPVSFIENVFPELLQGKTLAEAMIGDTCTGDTIIVGDPTFHFTI
jgi:hypothetical protein